MRPLENLSGPKQLAGPFTSPCGTGLLILTSREGGNSCPGRCDCSQFIHTALDHLMTVSNSFRRAVRTDKKHCRARVSITRFINGPRLIKSKPRPQKKLSMSRDSFNNFLRSGTVIKCRPSPRKSCRLSGTVPVSFYARRSGQNCFCGPAKNHFHAAPRFKLLASRQPYQIVSDALFPPVQIQ